MVHPAPGRQAATRKEDIHVTNGASHRFDRARPVPVETMLEGLGFANALIPVARHIRDEGVDPLQDPAVLDPQMATPGGLVPYELHDRVSRTVPPPLSSRSTEASGLRAFTGSRGRQAVSFSDS